MIPDTSWASSVVTPESARQGVEDIEVPVGVIFSVKACFSARRVCFCHSLGLLEKVLGYCGLHAGKVLPGLSSSTPPKSHLYMRGWSEEQQGPKALAAIGCRCHARDLSVRAGLLKILIAVRSEPCF